MSKKLVGLMSFIFLLFCDFVAKAQDDSSPVEVLRKDGKIYVVVAVISVILIGLFIYLFMLDRKVSKIEKEVDTIDSNQR
ncbi:MAG: CcmD family protein [Bacteroidota bacterium]